MLEQWISHNDNLANEGSEGGIIQLDDELPGLARIQIELKASSVVPPGDHYAITIGVYGILVHTAYFKELEDAMECTNAVKIIIQAMRANRTIE
jgi:hypothetical protein